MNRKLKKGRNWLYWLKQEKATNIGTIAQAIGRHRGTLQKWLGIYRDKGLEALLRLKGVLKAHDWSVDNSCLDVITFTNIRPTILNSQKD